MAVITPTYAIDPVTGLPNNGAVVDEIAPAGVVVFGPVAKVLSAPAFDQLVNTSHGYSG